MDTQNNSIIEIIIIPLLSYILYLIKGSMNKLELGQLYEIWCTFSYIHISNVGLEADLENMGDRKWKKKKKGKNPIE